MLAALINFKKRLDTTLSLCFQLPHVEACSERNLALLNGCMVLAMVLQLSSKGVGNVLKARVLLI